jgi:uncharacterized delta-60 repeat protein
MRNHGRGDSNRRPRNDYFTGPNRRVFVCKPEGERHLKNSNTSLRLIALVVAAMLIPVNLSSGGRAAVQDVEAQAAPGNLDTTFGSGGKVITPFPGFTGAGGFAIAVQEDGKMVVAAEISSDTAQDFGMVRYNTNGSLDTSFGSGGFVTTDFFGFRDFARAVAIQQDGKILVGGGCQKSASTDSTDFGVARYNADGSLDGGFGAGGKLSLDMANGSPDSLKTILVQSDGRIVLFGLIQNGPASGGLARVNQNGSLDTSFGSGGKVNFPAFNPFAAAFAADGRILVAGEIGGTTNVASGDFGMARFNADGSLDTRFGNAGSVATDFFGHTDIADAVAFQPDGRIVLAGLASTADDSAHQDFALARYSSEGALDPTFGNGGKVTTDFSGGRDRALSVIIISGERIVVGGQVEGQSRDFALACYQPNGSLDPTFGADGKVITSFSGSSAIINSILASADARTLVAAGTAFPSVALARYVALQEPASFSLAFDQATVTGERGTKAPVFILITRNGGFTGNVTITPPDASEIKVIVKPGDPISTTDSSVKFKLKIKAGASRGPHQLTFTGKDDSGRVATASVTLVVQ